MTGLRDGCLKKEVYRACETFTVNSLRRFCTAYDVSADYDSISVTAALEEPQITDSYVTDCDAVNSATSTRPLHRHTTSKPQQKRQSNAQLCGNYNRLHAPERMHGQQGIVPAITTRKWATSRKLAEARPRRYLGRYLWLQQVELPLPRCCQCQH